MIKHLYRHQQLSALMEAGHGLSMDQVHALGEIEAYFESEVSKRPKTVEELAEEVEVLRPARLDQCFLVSAQPGLVELFDCPRISEDECVTVILKDEEFAYLFNAKVIWVDQTDDGNRVSLRLVDAPVQKRHQRASTSQGLRKKIA